MSSSDEDADDCVVTLAPSAGGPIATKKKRNVFPRFKQGICYPFLECNDERDMTIFKCLMLSKPFAVGKGQGLTKSWEAAVEEINKQVDFVSGDLIFDPPVSVKTVRDRFDGAMKIIAELDNAVPFRSGNDDEDSPNELRTILEDLLSMKVSFESAAATVKETTVAKKKKDRDAAKAIQEAAIGQWASAKLTDTDSSDEANNSPESSGEKKNVKRNRSSLINSYASMNEIMEERRQERKAKSERKAAERALKHRLVEEQLAERAQQRLLAEQQTQVTLQMVAMLKSIAEQLKNNNQN